MRPEWTYLERPGYAQQVWDRSGPTFRSKVLDPHFEHLARTWARWHAAPESLGGLRSRVASGTLPDPAERTSHELDVVVFGRSGDDGVGDRELILAIGEAKSHDVIGHGHLHRLERLRELLSARDDRARGALKLLLFSGQGFTPELTAAAHDRDDVELIDPDRLYHGN